MDENRFNGQEQQLSSGQGQDASASRFQVNGEQAGGTDSASGRPEELYSGEPAYAPKASRHTGIKVFAGILAAIVLISGTVFAMNHAQDYLKAFSRSGKVEIVTTLTRAGSSRSTSGETDSAIKTTDGGTTLIESEDIPSTEKSEGGTVVLDVSEIVENVMPAVVSIVDTLEYRYSSYYNPYDYFFGSGSSSREEVPASGSGVIVGVNDSELMIVTNAHVVNNEETSSSYSVSSLGLTVTFTDDTTASAYVKGSDTEADLAVIAVKLSDISDETKSKIRIAVVGDSDTLKVGAGVIAIGNAMGYGQSVTTGIVSAKERPVTIDGVTRYLLQTDAAINPGNSGGGLFNAAGELIGINCAKTVNTQVEGMGFAIPITSAAEIIEELMNTVTLDEEEQGYLGISGSSVPDSYITRYGYPAGVVISSTVEGSPADKAGLQYYDIITKVNDKTVTSMEELKKIVNGYPAGTTVTLLVQRPSGRGFRTMTVEVKLISYKELQALTGEEEPETPSTELP